MLRNICAVLVGLIAGMAFNMAIVMLDTVLYPMPEGVDFNNAEGMQLYIATLPLVALLIVMVAHVGQAFVGGLVAACISKSSPMLVAMIVGSISLLGGIWNMMNMPMPAWMWVEAPLYLIAAYAAAKIKLGRSARIKSPPPHTRLDAARADASDQHGQRNRGSPVLRIWDARHLGLDWVVTRSSRICCTRDFGRLSDRRC